MSDRFSTPPPILPPTPSSSQDLKNPQDLSWYHDKAAGGYTFQTGKFAGQALNETSAKYLGWVRKVRTMQPWVLDALDAFYDGLEDYLETNPGEFLIPFPKYPMKKIKDCDDTGYLYFLCAHKDLRQNHKFDIFFKALRKWLQTSPPYIPKRDIHELLSQLDDDAPESTLPAWPSTPPRPMKTEQQAAIPETPSSALKRLKLDSPKVEDVTDTDNHTSRRSSTIDLEPELPIPFATPIKKRRHESDESDEDSGRSTSSMSRATSPRTPSRARMSGSQGRQRKHTLQEFETPSKPSRSSEHRAASRRSLTLESQSQGSCVSLTADDDEQDWVEDVGSDQSEDEIEPPSKRLRRVSVTESEWEMISSFRQKAGRSTK